MPDRSYAEMARWFWMLCQARRAGHDLETPNARKILAALLKYGPPPLKRRAATILKRRQK